jgi:hypothetical protein
LVEVVVVASVIPDAFDAAAIVDHYPRSILHVVFVFAFEVEDSVEVGLAGSVLAPAFSKVLREGAFEAVTIGKFENAVSLHEVVPEVASID